MCPAHKIMYRRDMARSQSAAELRRTVQALMDLHGETQGQLATALGITQGQISRKLNGKAVIALEDCDAIAHHYGITTAELLSGTAVAITRSQMARKPNGSAHPADPSASPQG